MVTRLLAIVPAVIAVLKSKSMQEHYEPLYRPHAKSLGLNHIGLLHGFTRDLLPLNKRAAITQMSAFNSNIKSASNSPHQHHPVGLTRAKEDDDIMHEQYVRAL